MEIEWKKEYEVGNLEIDAEHKVFVKIIQKIQHAIEGQAEKKYLERLVLELLKYAEFHFCSEENVMLEIGYPEILDHKEKHEKLLAELRNLIFAFGFDKHETHELVDFLIGWFMNHTIEEDKKLSNYVEEEMG
jgi:hemerythrin